MDGDHFSVGAVVNSWQRCKVDFIALAAGLMQSWTSPVLPKLEAGGEESPLGAPITSDEGSWIASLVGLGSILGPFLFSPCSERFGRKWSLLAIALLAVLSNLLLAFGGSLEVYYAARVLCGLASGAMFPAVTGYIVELSEVSIRGVLAASMNVAVVLGQLVAYSVGPYTSVMAFSFICLAPPLVYLVLFRWLAPETPQFYIANGDDAAAKAALALLRSGDVDKEVEELKALLRGSTKPRLGEVLRSRKNLRVFGICIALLTFQQFSGIIAILAYMQSIFAAAKTTISSDISPIVIGAVQFGASFLTPLIVDRYGRRFLLLFSAFGMLLSEATLGAYFYLDPREQEVVPWLPLLCLVVYIVAYVSGLGPLPWTVMAELLPEEVRAVASSTAASVCCFYAFILMKFFGNLSDVIGMSGCFWFFSAWNLTALVFTFFFVPETKGKTAREIQEMLDS